MSRIPGKPSLDNPTESTFTAEWPPVNDAVGYKVEIIIILFN
jgi:hypothetical protein